MNEKVKLTKEQAIVIEDIKKYRVPENTITTHFNCGLGGWVDEYISLNGMPLDTLIRALYIGYEVEQTVEEQLKDYYESIMRYDHIEEAEVFKSVLNIIGMKVKGINA